MFVDACAMVALLADEPEAERVSRALAGAPVRITSPVAVLMSAATEPVVSCSSHLAKVIDPVVSDKPHVCET